jgi:alpha-D-xyloside xylohydrolase
MIGIDLLAAPILEPNTTSRKVYFPSGYRWYDFFTGKLYLSGTQIVSNASLTQ